MAVATMTMVATVLFISCAEEKAEKTDLSVVPVQRVSALAASQTKNGVVVMRMQAETMLKYDNAERTLDEYPHGFAVYAYTDEGLLETEILSDKASHLKYKKKEGEEWKLFGHVKVRNVIKDEILSTDTLYWDQASERLYTDCYVRLTSPDGLLQGYGLESDQRARQSSILNAFDSYGRTVQDSTKVYVDTVNFIGPFPKKCK